MPLPTGIHRNQYRTQAKDLLKQARAGDPEATNRIQRGHPERDVPLTSGRLRLADCQLVVARELGYGSWAKLQQDLLFRNAVAAIDSGDLSRLGDLLQKRPTLVRYRCRLDEWYAAGYFQGATLLHHVAGNPIRCPLPANILDVARLLLRHKADANAATEGGSTTIGLLLTSRQASEAGVALPLIDLLRAAGAKDDVSGPETLSLPLLNLAPATAAELVRRGSVMDMRHASALGRLDELKTQLDSDHDIRHREDALAFACIRGQEDAARLLIGHGAKGDVLVMPGGQTPRTALHEAANRGHLGIVTLLLENGADARVIEPRWGGTAAGWAKHGGYAEIATLLE